MTTTVQMPVNTGKPARLGRGLYRKQILPVGKTLNVGGQQLALTRGLLADIKTAFDAGLPESAPFQLVDASNSHTDDPERTRGNVRALDLTDDGLYATLDLPDSLLEHNPSLGVSARLLFDQNRADGRKGRVVLRHVAATTDPHVGGMKPFERLADLSQPSESVVDLTAATYQGDSMASLTDEQLSKLARFLDTLPDGESDGAADPQPEPEPDNGDVSEEELQALLAELGDDDEPQPETDQTDAEEPAADGELVGAGLSADGSSIDLAASLEQTRSELAAVQEQLHTEKWQARRADLVSAGVPPFLVDLAAPVLSKPARQLDLSAGDANPYQVIDQMLDKCRGIVDLAAERGLGHVVEKDEQDELEQFVSQWKSQF
jgi:hypothetical protein